MFTKNKDVHPHRRLLIGLEIGFLTFGTPLVNFKSVSCQGYLVDIQQRKNMYILHKEDTPVWKYFLLSEVT